MKNYGLGLLLFLWRAGAPVLNSCQEQPFAPIFLGLMEGPK